MSLKKDNPNFGFQNLFKKGDYEGLQTLKDATLQSEDGTTFEVHRFLLASRNNYFFKLFCGDNSKNNRFTLHMDAKTLDHILVYLYTGEISLTEVNVPDVLIAANTLLVDDLVNMCQEFAAQNINVSNCLRLFIAAWEIGKLPFVDTCYRYVQVHFEKVVQNTWNTIGEITLEALKKFLEDRNLNVTSEKVAWMSIVRWVEKNQQERLPHVPELLECLFLNMDESLKSEILEHALVKHNPYFKVKNTEHGTESPDLDGSLCEIFEDLDVDRPCLKVLSAKQRRKLFLKHSSGKSSNLRTKRIPTHINFVASYSAVRDNSHTIPLYLTYDDQLDIWRQVGEIEFWPDSLLNIKERIYMFNSREDRRVAFDICNGSFWPISPMSIPRLHYRVVALNGSIYALGGGTEEDETTSILECYNPETDLWRLLHPMVPMILSEVVAMAGKIFAVGRDDDGLDSEMKLQVYDPVTDSWSMVAAPTVYRKRFASVVFEGKLYMMGGHDDYGSLKNSEVYDPSSNVWTALPQIPFIYISPRAIIFKHKLIIHENLYKNLRYGVPCPPVSWDSTEKKWEVINQDTCSIDMSLYQFCVIQEQEILEHVVRKFRCPDVSWMKGYVK